VTGFDLPDVLALLAAGLVAGAVVWRGRT